MKKVLILILYFLTPVILLAQSSSDKKLIQFSGVVLHADSLEPLPFVNVINVSRGHRGTYTDFKGFFSLVVSEGDTIHLSYIGYKKVEVVIPVNMQTNTFSQVLKIHPDVVNLPMVYIFPFATVEQFKEAFINLKIPDDYLTIAQKNLSHEVMLAMSTAMTWDGSMNSRNYFQQQSEKLYYAGQTRPNPLFDVVKLAQFIHLLNEGKISFRNEKKD